MALRLFVEARISFRAVSRVMGVLAALLGIKKAPSPQTIINWVTRLTIVRMQSVYTLDGLHRPQFSNGWIWMIDMSIGLGTGKILAVLALRADHHERVSAAAGFENVHCVAVSVADSWTGVSIAAFLGRVIAVAGRPTAYLKDGGTDLRKAVRLLDEKGLASPEIDDISHAIANLLKWHYQDHPLFEIFVSACGRVSGNLKQTALASLAPPRVQSKARFMNLHRLVTWADQLLKLSPPGRAPKGSVLEKLRACLDLLPSCKPFIRLFRADATPLLECERILKTRGLSHQSLVQCEPLIQTIHTSALRREFDNYLHCQLETADRLDLGDVGMPVSSDPIESLYGQGKHHGTGEIKDADRIALRLPALCHIPSRAEAEQVLGISVAQQRELLGGLTSLIKQRREVLSDPSRLETLDSTGPRPHLELIPRAINRSNGSIILELPISCTQLHGPEPVYPNAYG